MPPVRRWIPVCLLALLGVAPTAGAQTTTTSTSSTTTTSLVPITFTDPGFSVKRIWSGGSRAIPGDLGGLFFSADGATLYVVGDLLLASNRLYALGVVRGGSGEVTDLSGPAVAMFGGSAVGLDSGFAFGPGGTLFYGYYPANQLLQRPGGVGGAESGTAMGGQLASGTGGVTFNPMRIDPQSGAGMLLVNNGNALMYEVPLAPLGGGLYETGTLAQYVKTEAPVGGMGKMLFLPAPYQGQLLYAAFGDGQLRLIQIDPGSGLPIHEPTGLPQLGTTNPVDTVFADGFGSDAFAGPLGLAVDPVSSDLFVTTSQGSPANTIFQVGGFAAGIGTTTTTFPATSSTVPVTTSSTSTVTITTTSTSTTSMPSTTLPTCGGVAPLCGGSCPDGLVCDGLPLQPCACVSALTTTSTTATLPPTTSTSSTSSTSLPITTTSSVPLTTSTSIPGTTSTVSSTTLPSSSTTTSSSVSSTSVPSTTFPGSTTTSTSLPPGSEICGNCRDDDGNGLTDYEDPSCCTGPIVPLQIDRLRVRSGVATSKVKLVASGLPALPALSPFVHAVFVQVAAGEDAPQLCAALDPVRFRGKTKKATFSDRPGAVPEALGISSIRLQRLGTGALRLRLAASRAALTVPATASRIRLAIAFADMARPDTPIRCAAAATGVVPARRGGVTLP